MSNTSVSVINSPLSNDLHFPMIIKAPLEECFNRWITEIGLQSFFCPNLHIDPRPCGLFDMYFNTDEPQGLQGSENCRYMAIQKNEMISFTWNSPPQLPAIRNQYTFVRLLFSGSSNQTHFLLSHMGMGVGPIWQKNRDYFCRAWGSIVLPQYKYVCEGEKIDWTAPPSLENVPTGRPDNFQEN